MTGAHAISIPILHIGKDVHDVHDHPAHDLAVFPTQLGPFAAAVRARLDAGRAKEPGYAKDPGLRNFLVSIDSILADLVRSRRRDALVERAVLDVVESVNPATLDRDRAEDLLLNLEPLLIECAGDDALFERAEVEGRKTSKMTSWLTWGSVFPGSTPPGLATYLDGKEVSAQDREGTRRHLLALLRARREDEMVHRARQELRRRNLRYLFLCLAGMFGVLAVAALVFLGRGLTTEPMIAGLAGAALFGALGAALSGAMKARDRLSRTKDIESFRDGFPAQVAVGAGTGLVFVLIFESGLLTVAGVDPGLWSFMAVAGFLAGFSEPIFLKTIERIGTLGSTPETKDGTTDTAAATS